VPRIPCHAAPKTDPAKTNATKAMTGNAGNTEPQITSTRYPGTQGYSEHADELISRYETTSLPQKYGTALQLLPATPGQLLDLGAGTGADAAWLAARGHRVVAVEPVARFRDAGATLHPSPAITWLDDGLPDLALVAADARQFDAILLTAVWMHLDESQRKRAMPILANLLLPTGALLLTLRHGPTPAGRCMFDATAEEAIGLAKACGLRVVFNERAPSAQPGNRAAGVEWTRLGLCRDQSVWSPALETAPAR
jgi:SAM-dependent methyltransferase